MALYKIRHALASWTNTDGTPGMAFRTQTAEIPDAEAKRLKEYFAIIGPDEEVEHPGILQDLPQSPSDEEILNWIANANASEVRALASTRPELVPRIEGALTSVKTARAYEDEHLNEIRMAMQPGGLSPDGTDILGSAGATGRDTTDTSATGDEDIVMPDPALGPAGAGIEPPGGGAGVGGPETNTELKDANGNPDSLPPVDHSVLVQGTGQDVANYIGAHPEQAASILAAEEAHTEGSPRVEVVNAVRAATGFTG